ncbi:hypothetical protein ANH9381_0976 [Aggregatibacter actinomycetemcomitans ANH9381]|nr:hypothetical protein ANH9381_0976 [Aggregatibacter actinomycetemcomitans ANH9381]
MTARTISSALWVETLRYNSACWIAIKSICAEEWFLIRLYKTFTDMDQLFNH